jgi:hypothetical protein
MDRLISPGGWWRDCGGIGFSLTCCRRLNRNMRSRSTLNIFTARPSTRHLSISHFTMGNKVSLEEELINLKITSKQMQRSAKKCEKNEKAAIERLKKVSILFRTHCST